MLSKQNLSHTKSTETLIRMMDRFFDCINMKRHRNHTKKPHSSDDAWRFDVSTLFQTLNISHLVYYKSHITGYLKKLFSLIL